MTDLKIEWRGEILTDIGYGIQARRILKPLMEAGVDVKLLPAEDYIPDHRRIKDLFWLEQIEESKKKPDAPIRICYEVPPISQYRKEAFNIAYSMWETTRYPREWEAKINQANMFFTGCPALMDSAKKAGITVPCSPVMPPIDLDMWTPEGPTLTIDGIKPDDVVFMINANWIPRKNFGDLLVGFCCALHGVKDAVLVVKTWGGDNSVGFQQQVKENLSGRLNSLVHIDRPRVLLLADLLPEQQIVKLMRRSDVYLTVSHGEGFDLPLVQAMSLGKLVVATRFLGHEYYMNDSNSIIVKHSLVPVVDAKAPHYASDQMWSRPDVDHMIECVRKAYDMAKRKSGPAEDMGKEARKTIVDKFHKDVTTKQLIDILSNIQQPVGAA